MSVHALQDLMSQGRLQPKKNVPHAQRFAVNYADDTKQIYGQTPGSYSPPGTLPPTTAMPAWQGGSSSLQALPSASHGLSSHSAQPQHMSLYSSQSGTFGGPMAGTPMPQQPQQQLPMGLYASHGYQPQMAPWQQPQQLVL
jgi:hypothetical protein